jgi:hypothetical protein
MPKTPPPDKLADAYEEIRNLKNQLHARRGLEEKVAMLERQVEFERGRVDYVIDVVVGILPTKERNNVITQLLHLVSRNACVAAPRATGTDEKERPDVIDG